MLGRGGAPIIKEGPTLRGIEMRIARLYPVGKAIQFLGLADASGSRFKLLVQGFRYGVRVLGLRVWGSGVCFFLGLGVAVCSFWFRVSG